MILYNDDKLVIDIDNKPKILVRYVYPGMSKDEVEAVETYPFINKSNIVVTVKSNDDYYTIPINKGYTWDGSTIPKIFWRIIGSNSQPEFLLASMVHDKLCEEHSLVNHHRRLSTDVFRGLLLSTGVKVWKSNLMSFFVDLYQRLFW